MRNVLAALALAIAGAEACFATTLSTRLETEKWVLSQRYDPIDGALDQVVALTPTTGQNDGPHLSIQCARRGRAYFRLITLFIPRAMGSHSKATAILQFEGKIPISAEATTSTEPFALINDQAVWEMVAGGLAAGKRLAVRLGDGATVFDPGGFDQISGFFFKACERLTK